MRKQCLKIAGFAIGPMGKFQCIDMVRTLFTPVLPRHFSSHKSPVNQNITQKHNKSDCSCVSCGIQLQNTDPDQPGFYTPPSAKTKNKNVEISDLKYLLFSQNIQKAKDLERKLYDPEFNESDDLKYSKLLSPEMIDKERNNRLSCKRCINIIHKNEYNLEKDFVKLDYDDIKKAYLSEDSKDISKHVIHVTPLPFFPIGLKKTIVADYHKVGENKENTQNELSVLFSKADQVLGSESLLNKKAPPFMDLFFEKYLDVKKGSLNVVFFSALKRWNVEAAYNILKKQFNYLLGEVNAGKSTLINAWLKKYPNSTRAELTNKNESFHSQKAGVSHIPNMTRDMSSYLLNGGSKLVIDLPGFESYTHKPPLQHLVDKKFSDLLLKTEKFKNSKVTKRPYISVKGKNEANVLGRAYTIGGLFYVIPPPRTISKVHQFIPGPDYIFSNLEKAFETVRRLKVEKDPKMIPMETYIHCKDTLAVQENFTRHIIPPFVGSVEVVIDGVGYFQLTASGTYHYYGLYEIWVPKGIKVAVRVPLQKVIEQSYDSFVTAKNNCTSSSMKKDIKYGDFFPKGPLVSDTYPLEHSIPREEALAEIRKQFLERTASDVMKRGPLISTPEKELELLLTVSGKDTKLYWYYGF